MSVVARGLSHSYGELRSLRRLDLAVAGDEVVLRLISPLRPGLLQAADGSGFQYLLMPIRLNV